MVDKKFSPLSSLMTALIMILLLRRASDKSIVKLVNFRFGRGPIFKKAPTYKKAPPFIKANLFEGGGGFLNNNTPDIIG